MLAVGFEPTISAGERPQTYALDRAATEAGYKIISTTLKLKVCVDVCVYTYIHIYNLESQITICTSRHRVRIFSCILRVLGGALSLDEQEHKEVKTRRRWAKLTYVGRQTKFITKLFRNSDFKVSFKTENTVGKLLTQNKNINLNKFNKCGVRQLTCHDCNRKYIGQADRPFHIRFQEHFRDFKYGNVKSKCAQHN